MRIAIVMLLVLSFCGIAQAWDDEYEISPRYSDFNSNDGFMDAGSKTNPYVIKDEYGREQATIEPRYHDFNKNDGIMDAGSSTNPYVIKRRRY